MDIELTSRLLLSREEAARRLHALADDLARHNALTLVRDGRRVVVDVPDQVNFKMECELGDGNEIELELSWPAA